MTTNLPKGHLGRRSYPILISMALIGVLIASSPATAVEVASPTGSILVVAPHPDDDVITTAGITYNRPNVTIAYMTNGDTDPGGAIVRQDEAVEAQRILGQVFGSDEDNLVFLGYPDAHLLDVWNTPTGAWGGGATDASRGLGMTDWHDYRTGSVGQHADFNKVEMIADLVALIDQYRPDHIFTTSSWDNHTDHATTNRVVDAALEQMKTDDPAYGTIVHETIVWHPDTGIYWPQDRDASAYIVSDVSLGASPSIETASAGALAWNQREQFLIPASWVGVGDANPKAEAIDAHQNQGGLGGFIGRWVHRDEIFWASYVNYPVLSISNATATEGSNASFTISRTGALNVAVSVTATTSNGTATSPADYTAKSEVVTLGVGQAAATFLVATVQDTDSEASETFNVTLSSPTNQSTLDDSVGVGTINNNETDDPSLLIDDLGGLVLSESGGSDTYRISLGSQPSAPVTVALAPDGQLFADRSSVTFTTSNWSTPQTVTLQAIDDSAAEANPHPGTVTHTTSSADTGYNSLPQATANAAIAENLTIAGPTTAATGSPLTFSAESGATSYSWRVTSNGAEIATAPTADLTFTAANGGDHTIEVTATVGTTSVAASHSLKVLGDIAGSTFAADIVWLADAAITQGCNPPANDQFCPSKNVTRGQMAAFLVRFLGLTDDGGGNTFTDDNGSVFEDDIAKLAAAGVTTGCNKDGTEFCPNKNVTRGQMAAFLVRALGLTDEGGGNTFIDDNGSVFEDDIAKLAAAGVTAGCNPPANNQFCPDKNVTRGQMAAFLRRAAALDG
jgi:LmbE family N-acetylglucosaminyl deacetylase